MLPPPLLFSRLRSLEECDEKEGYEGFLCKWGLGSEPVARGEVIACRRPIAVSVGWEEDGEERVGERSTDLCFFLWGGGPEPSWSDTGTIKEKIDKYKCSVILCDNICSLQHINILTSVIVVITMFLLLLV